MNFYSLRGLVKIADRLGWLNDVDQEVLDHYYQCCAENASSSPSRSERPSTFRPKVSLSDFFSPSVNIRQTFLGMAIVASSALLVSIPFLNTHVHKVEVRNAGSLSGSETLPQVSPDRQADIPNSESGISIAMSEGIMEDVWTFPPVSPDQQADITISGSSGAIVTPAGPRVFDPVDVADLSSPSVMVIEHSGADVLIHNQATVEDLSLQATSADEVLESLNKQIAHLQNLQASGYSGPFLVFIDNEVLEMEDYDIAISTLLLNRSLASPVDVAEFTGWSSEVTETSVDY